MPKFRYLAMDAKGQEVESEIDADNEAKAVAAIRARQLFPTKVQAVGGLSRKTMVGAAPVVRAQVQVRKPKGNKFSNMFGGRVAEKHLMALTRQLSTLVNAGMPLLRGLGILVKQPQQPALRDALYGIRESVEGGSTFSEALGQYPKIFDKLFVNMVKAGEAGGVLDVVLRRLAEFMEKAEQVKAKIKSAMVYPVVVMIAAAGIVAFLMIQVIPQFERIFKEMMQGASLPVLTRLVIAISRGFTKHYIQMGVGIAVVVISFKGLVRTAKGKLVLDKFKLAAPIFGDLVQKTAVARFSRTLGTLMTNGVPLLQALNIVRDTSGNEIVARAIAKIHDSVKEGESMSAPMESSKIFPPIVISMVDVGEETGKTPEMLIKIADNYEEEVDRAVDALTSVLEPLMIVMLAVVIGVIVIAMFVPLISIIGDMAGQN